MNQPGRGRKPILSLQKPVHIESVKTAVKKNAQSIKQMVAELETALETEMSPDTVKLSYTRLRTSLKSRQMSVERESKVAALKILEKPTVPIIDNRSRALFEQIEKWEEKGSYIFFLPKYSPH